jgi:hypothetical protein
MAKANNPGRKRPLCGVPCRDCPAILTADEHRQGCVRCPPCRKVAMAAARQPSGAQCPCGLELTRREVRLELVRCGRCRKVAPGRVVIDHTPGPLKAPSSWWIGLTRTEINAYAHDEKNQERMRRGVSYWSGLMPGDEPRRGAKARAEA